MSNNGFVYVLNTKGYLDEAKSSIKSLRRHNPEANITIISPTDLFDRGLESINWMQLEGSYDSPIIKTEAIRAPYDRTVFIDTDTLVAGDLNDLFVILDSFDIAAAHEPLRGWDYHIDAPRAFCELNTGVIAFKKSAKITSFFEAWKDNYTAMRRKQDLRNDQPAFRKTLWDASHIRHSTLTTEFHMITIQSAAIAWEARILHGRGDLEAQEKEINKTMGPRVFAPGWGVVLSPSGRKQRLRMIGKLILRAIQGMTKAESQTLRKSPVVWHVPPEKQ